VGKPLRGGALTNVFNKFRGNVDRVEFPFRTNLADAAERRERQRKETRSLSPADRTVVSRFMVYSDRCHRSFFLALLH
jgi:hypothetical protein